MTDIEIEFFLDMLSIESTSGSERFFGEWLSEKLRTETNEVTVLEVGDGTVNIECKWGIPRVWFCTHCDTVPPYISPEKVENRIYGRGACDAKGQIFSMFMACIRLEKSGFNDFGLLILAGEETGSFGAKAYSALQRSNGIVIVGEPTDNAMVKASKGTHAFEITLHGKSCHSGYPELGCSAIDLFVDFLNKLRNVKWPNDELLGLTTWNIGELHSRNRQNILSEKVCFRLYFRTTFQSAPLVKKVLLGLLPDGSDMIDNGGDTPTQYITFEGFPQTVVAFGSDTPHLHCFSGKILCGPGSITVAHTHDEYIEISDIEKAIEQYFSFAKILLLSNSITTLDNHD